MKRFDSDMPKAIPFKEATKETPIFTVWTVIDAPLRGLAVGLAVLLLGGLVVLGAGWSFDVALIAAGGSGLLYLGWIVYNLPPVMYQIEKLIGHDLNQDGFVGEPLAPSEPWRIILEKEDGSQMWLNFDSEEQRQKAMLVAVLVKNGTPFSEGALTGTNRPLSRTEFNNLRDLFMARGLCLWQNPEVHTLGIKWTPYGKSMINRLAAGEGTTPPRIRTPRGAEYALPERVGEGGGE
jgi:hypothetical protein